MSKKTKEQIAEAQKHRDAFMKKQSQLSVKQRLEFLENEYFWMNLNIKQTMQILGTITGTKFKEEEIRIQLNKIKLSKDIIEKFIDELF